MAEFTPVPAITLPATLPPLPTALPVPAGLPTSIGEVLSTLAPLAPTLVPALTSLPAVQGLLDNATGIAKVATDAAKSALTGVPVVPTVAPLEVPTPKPHHVAHVAGVHTSKPGASSEPSLMDQVKPFIIPIVALVVGGFMMRDENIDKWGKLVVYFGAQSFMNIFMSWVLGTHVTLPRGSKLENGYVLPEDLKGCPAGFAITALQQVASFFMFLLFFVVRRVTGDPYEPKRLTDSFQYVSVVIFGCVFAANIALNNFSLGYISISVNLIIRSCLPLSTYMSQQALANCGYYQKKEFRILEIGLMVIGVLSAFLFAWADSAGHIAGSQLQGIIACIGSLLCGSLNLALAGVLGDKSVKLNVLDTCAYMSVPATLFLLPIVFFYSKAVPNEWAFVGAPAQSDWSIPPEISMTDGQILQYTWMYSKPTIAWLFISGILSFMYNLCQFNIVHTLSPSATAFGGNFNKAALTFMTLLLPFLQTKPNPPQPYYSWEWVALLVNIAAFSMYSYMQIKPPPEQKHEELESDEEEGSTGSE